MQFHVKPTLQIKKNAITDDYKVTSSVLGQGINGRVIEVFQRKTGEKFALKVSLCQDDSSNVVPVFSLCWQSCVHVFHDVELYVSTPDHVVRISLYQSVKSLYCHCVGNTCHTHTGL